jgi:hypothetical protein
LSSDDSRKAAGKQDGQPGATNAAAMAVILPVLHRLAPDGHLGDDGEYYMLNPRRADKNEGSFKFNTTTGVWADFAVPDDPKARGRFPMTLVAYLDNITYGEAFLRLEALLGLKPWGANFGERYRPLTEAERATAPSPAKVKPKPTAYTPLVVPPEREGDLARWLYEMHHGDVTATWYYRDAGGRLLFAVIRRETMARGRKKSRKIFAPVCLAIDPRFSERAAVLGRKAAMAATLAALPPE